MEGRSVGVLDAAEGIWSGARLALVREAWDPHSGGGHGRSALCEWGALSAVGLQTQRSRGSGIACCHLSHSLHVS